MAVCDDFTMIAALTGNFTFYFPLLLHLRVCYRSLDLLQLRLRFDFTFVLGFEVDFGVERGDAILSSPFAVR